MARAHFVSRANKDIYENGKTVSYKSKKGKNKGQMLSKLDRTIPENSKDKVLIKKGEPYYWYQFKGSERTISRTAPKPSQLTRSGYLSQLYDLQDRLSSIRDDVNEPEDLSTAVDEIKTDLESLKEECEGSLGNMPEALQETSSSGELLRERIDSLDNAISELDGIDCDDFEEIDEADLREEAIEALGLIPHEEDDEFGGGDDKEEIDEHGFTDDEQKQIDAKIDELKDEKKSEWLDEKCDELSNVSFD